MLNLLSRVLYIGLSLVRVMEKHIILYAGNHLFQHSAEITARCEGEISKTREKVCIVNQGLVTRDRCFVPCDYGMLLW